ncbi:MAG: divergent PAP2 family protein [Ruminococcaceae bacterium]|nr:divergent PAP2 family protein [Oscillospiraceae bacterium]
MLEIRKFIVDLFTNPVVLCATFSWLMAQFIKVLTTPKYRKDKSVLQVLFGSGGMPSSHSAAVFSAAIAIGLHEGFDSAIFAIAGVLAMVVIRDATGIRREAGKHAAVLNQITEELNKEKEDEESNFKYTLKVLLGHTPLQVFFGAVLGVAMAFICHYWIFPLMLTDHIPPLI